jgi:hypothetical protein
MKKFNLLTKIFVLFLSANSFAQGLQGIVVEKYYKANAADVANATANSAVTPLTTNSITYRVYVDLADGWKLNNIWGNSAHPLTINTTTAFFNDPNNGIEVNGGTTSLNNYRTNTTFLDSYLTFGNVCTGKLGILKSEDTDGTVGALTAGLLVNNPGGCFGDPIMGTSGKDGLVAGSPQSLTTLGLPTSINIFNQTNGGAFSMNGGAIGILAGLQGPTGSGNKILIGQFTTDGVFTFALNLQVKNVTTNAVEDYVSSAPTGSELTMASLTLAPNSAPSITAFTANPSTSGIISGTQVVLSANVTDNGTVSTVQFFNGSTLLTGGTVGGTAPNYTYTFTPTNGSYSITAVATDNECVSTTSSALTFAVAANQAPTITALAATTTTQFYPGQVVNLSCNAVDPENQTVTTTFSVNGGSPIASTASGSTFSATYTIPSNASPGAFSVTATATDSYSPAATATSSAITFNVTANPPPAVSVTSPTAGASLIAVGNPATLSMTLTATATDNNGIGSVVFYDNGTLLTTGTASNSGSTYTYVYTASPGTHTYYAKATDTYAAFTNSATVAVEIADPNALSYRVKNVIQNCDAVSYCMPVSVASTYTVANVIGYDISLKYNANKVTPTGNITLSNTANGLINPNFVETNVAIGTPVNGVGSLQITLNLNGAAGSSTYFAGTNKDIFCVEFIKTAGFTAVDTAVFTDLSVQESYITGVTTKPGSNGSAISQKNTTYIANLEFWSDNQAIKYDVANPSTYLKTDVKGSVSTTATATSASTSITVTSATGVASGMIVVANGVPAGTTVTNVSGTTVTISAATTAALSSTANPPSAVTFVNPATPVTPNTSGVFTHSLLNGQDLRIERDIAASTPVQLLVNGADAVLAKTLVLNGSFTPSVFQIMALDVNLDGVISAGDISQMKQRATLFIPEYRQAWNYTTAGVSNGQPSKDWVFVDVTRLSEPAYQISATFPANDATGYSKSKVPVAPFNLPAKVTNYATCPIVEVETYKGIMLGDVNASYATFTANGLLKSENGAVVLDLASAVKEGNTFRIPVSFESTESANALDFAVRFNENNVSFAELNNVAVGMEASSFMNEADRTLRFTGFDVANFTVGSTVAELVLQSNNETISEKDIIADLALINGKPVDVKFEKSSEAIQSVFNVSIYPNPSNGAFSVQATENAIVDVYDMNGKQITASQVISSNGKVNIDLNNVEAGVYLVRVQNETFSTTKRIVIEK